MSGQGTTSIVVSYPSNAVSGYVSAQAVNNCSISGKAANSIKLTTCPASLPRLTIENPSTQVVINKSVDKMDAQVSPNPTTSEFALNIVTAGKEQIKVIVMDMRGRMLKEFKAMPYQTVRFGNELMPGSYVVEIIQGTQKISKRVLKF